MRNFEFQTSWMNITINGKLNIPAMTIFKQGNNADYETKNTNPKYTIQNTPYKLQYLSSNSYPTNCDDRK